MYAELLVYVRDRSTLLEPVARGPANALAVRALVNLARNHDRLRRTAATWSGGDGGVYAQIGSLASHLAGGYPVPQVLAQAWFADESRTTRLHRRWFVAHARGTAVRALPDMPLALTRRMEGLFLASPPHLPVPAALRRAELLALGAEEGLVRAVLASPLGGDLGHASYWRPVLHWLVNQWDELLEAEVEELVAFVARQRNDGFSIRGRTPASMRRLMRAVPRALPACEGRDTASVLPRDWTRSGLAGFVYPGPWSLMGTASPRWRIVELLDAEALVAEGRALHHCVASYRAKCAAGYASIWSLRRERWGMAPEPYFTIEVDPHTRRVVQIRGECNRRVHGESRRIIAMWAMQQLLALVDGA